MNIGSRKLSNPFLVNIEMLWKKVVVFSASNELTDPFSFRKDFSLDLSYASLNWGVQFNLKRNSFRTPYLKAGLGYRHLLTDHSSMTSTSFNVATTRGPLVTLAKIGVGLYGAVGYSVKRFNIEVKYDITAIRSSKTRTTLNLNSINFVVGYRFLKT
jgi:hypothetical protein